MHQTQFTLLREGMKFSTFADYNRLFDDYKKQHGLNYVARSTKFITGKKYIDKPYNPDIVYGEYHMRCKHLVFDEDKKVEVDRNCPSEIKMVPRDQNQVLFLSLFNQNHNHPVKIVASDKDNLTRLEIVEAMVKDLVPALMAMDDVQFGQSLKTIKTIIDPSTGNEMNSFDENFSPETILNQQGSANNSSRDDPENNKNDSEGFELDPESFHHLLDETDSDVDISADNSATGKSNRLANGEIPKTKKDQGSRNMSGQTTDDSKELGNSKSPETNKDEGTRKLSGQKADDSKALGNGKNPDRVKVQNIRIMARKKNLLNAQGEAINKKNSTSVQSINKAINSVNTETNMTKGNNASTETRKSSSEPPQKRQKVSPNGKDMSSPRNQNNIVNKGRQRGHPKTLLTTNSASNNRATRSTKYDIPKDATAKIDEIPSSTHYNTRRSKDSFGQDVLKEHSKKDIVFKSLSSSEKTKIMLEWLGTPKRAVENILAKDYILTEKDVRKENQNFSVTTLFNGITSGDLKILKTFVTNEVYETVLASVAINEKYLKCETCSTLVLQNDKIVCAKCLTWYHMRCANVKKAPKLYACTRCK